MQSKRAREKQFSRQVTNSEEKKLKEKEKSEHVPGTTPFKYTLAKGGKDVASLDFPKPYHPTDDKNTLPSDEKFPSPHTTSYLEHPTPISLKTCLIELNQSVETIDTKPIPIIDFKKPDVYSGSSKNKKKKERRVSYSTEDYNRYV